MFRLILIATITIVVVGLTTFGWQGFCRAQETSIRDKELPKRLKTRVVILVIEKAGIGPNTDATEIFGNFALDSLPKHLSSCSRTCIIRTQYSRPRVSAVSFETKQGPVTGTLALLGIVSYFGLN
jgi:hypothetical protein